MVAALTTQPQNLSNQGQATKIIAVSSLAVTTSYAKDTSPTPGNEPNLFPSLNPINNPLMPTPTDLSASSEQ
jgi:hypothetical protein